MNKLKDATKIWRIDSIESVYDGDTFTCVIDVGLHGIKLHNQKIRVWGIDTPEMRGGTAETKQAAREARDALAQTLSDTKYDVFLQFKDAYTFGRLVCRVLLEDKDSKEISFIDEIMVQAGHAKPFVP